MQLTWLLCPWNFPGKNTGVGCHFLLQGIFPTRGLNPHFLHWQAVSLTLNHLESPTEYYIDNEKHKGWAVWVQTVCKCIFVHPGDGVAAQDPASGEKIGIHIAGPEKTQI